MSEYTQSVGTQTLSGGATKSMWLLTPAAARGFWISGLSVSLDNTNTSAEQVLVELYRTNSLGSPAGSSSIGIQIADEHMSGDTAQTASIYALSAEPTSVFILDGWYVSPNGGVLVLDWSEKRFAAKAGGASIGVRYTTPSAVTPKLYGALKWRED